jgi:hypothetical protein
MARNGRRTHTTDRKPFHTARLWRLEPIKLWSLKTAYREFPVYDSLNGFTDVVDAARAIIALMDSGIRNERFIISAENRSIVKFSTGWPMVSGKHPSKKPARFWQGLPEVRKMVSASRGIPLITRESVAIACRQNTYDNHKLLRALPTFHSGLWKIPSLRHVLITSRTATAIRNCVSQQGC